MNIAKDCVVQFHYILKDESGQPIESSRDGQPMAYLHGHRNIISGLEEAMEGRAAGDQFSVTVPPEKGYGERREGLSQRIPVKHLEGARKWKPGMVAVIQTEQGARHVTITKAGRFMADVDLNPPFAGRTLTFEVEILAVRAGTEEEVAHGHAHGDGGHHH